MYVYMRVSWGHLDVWGELASHKRFAESAHFSHFEKEKGHLELRVSLAPKQITPGGIKRGLYV